MRSRAAIVLCLMALPSVAAAHLGSRKYLRVEVQPGRVTVEVEVEAIDASMELGLGEDLNRQALMARAPQVRRWLERGVAMTAGETGCEVTSTDPVWRDRDGTPFLALTMTYTCGQGALLLRDDTIFPDDPQHEALVYIAWADGDDAQILRRGHRELALAGPTGAMHVASVFVWEGMLHFATGFDHILFLVSLVLAAGFVSRKHGIRKALRDVGILVTAFTLGHSATLITAALGVIVLPAKPVEVVIAASIIVVALLNLWRPEQRRAMPWLALGFGLVHGFGFSSVLAELGLPRGHGVVALVSFNIGIELAQLAFVACVMGPLAWGAKREGYGMFVRVGSTLIALMAVYWVVERIST